MVAWFHALLETMRTCRLNKMTKAKWIIFVYEEACILAKHRDRLPEIKYQEVERYFFQGAGYYIRQI